MSFSFEEELGRAKLHERGSGTEEQPQCQPARSSETPAPPVFDALRTRPRSSFSEEE